MSDRFFLNVVNSVTDSDNAKFLLDRSHYMQSLTQHDVLCVIMSSFGLNVESSQSEFLNLLGAESKVPTLIIHGDKRKSLAAASLLRKKTKSHRNEFSVGDSNTTTNGAVSGVSGNPGIVIKEERSAIVNEDGRSQKVTTEEFLSVLIKEEKLDVIIKQEKKMSLISEERSSSVIKREFVSTVVEKDAHTAKCNITNGAKSLLEDSPSKFQRPILQLHAHSDSDAHDVMTSTLLRCPESVYIERVKPQWSYPLKGIDIDRIENSAQFHQDENCGRSSDKRSRPNSNTENDNTYSCTSSGTGSREGSSPCGIGSKANITLDNADRTGLNPECAAGSANRLGGSVSGVHHPKYILTFTSKGLHVMIRYCTPSSKRLLKMLQEVYVKMLYSFSYTYPCNITSELYS